MLDRQDVACLALLVWAGFGLPFLIVPFLAPTPWLVPVVGVALTIATVVALVRARRGGVT